MALLRLRPRSSIASCFAAGFVVTRAWHYERLPCGHDEVQGEVLGTSGYICSPKCSESSYDCPTDAADYSVARPQCMLQDANKGAFCALLCKTDSHCGGDAQCQAIPQAGVSICVHPLSFTDWAHEGVTRKLTFGLPPERADQVAPGVLQKAVLAVQSLKVKYGIQDGDADIVAVKEFLASVGTSSVPAPPPPPATAEAAPGSYPGLGYLVGKDVDYEYGKLRQGLPGLKSQLQDTVWNIEHIQQAGVSWNLLRGFLELALLYLVLGAVYKRQAMGAEGLEMIPHVNFWMDYPELVADGVRYFRLLVGSQLGEKWSNESAGFQPMSSSNSDSFSQFSPARS